jgi:hypothetical protein
MANHEANHQCRHLKRAGMTKKKQNLHHRQHSANEKTTNKTYTKDAWRLHKAHRRKILRKLFKRRHASGTAELSEKDIDEMAKRIVDTLGEIVDEFPDKSLMELIQE